MYHTVFVVVKNWLTKFVKFKMKITDLRFVTRRFEIQEKMGSEILDMVK